MVLNGVQNSCGKNTSVKCATCNLKFICSKSPHCNFTHIDDNFDAISKFISGFYNQYQNDMSIEKDVLVQIQQNSNLQEIKLSEIKNDYDNKYIELNKKLDEIINKLLQSNCDYNNDSVDIEVPNSNSLEVYNNSKTYVEKKNLFGKTKWVEDK